MSNQRDIYDHIRRLLQAQCPACRGMFAGGWARWEKKQARCSRCNGSGALRCMLCGEYADAKLSKPGHEVCEEHYFWAGEWYA